MNARRLNGRLDLLKAVDRVTREEPGIAWAGHLNLAQHLADDDFKVLIMDVLTLRAIHFLYFGHQVHLASLTSLNFQNAMRVE